MALLPQDAVESIDYKLAKQLREIARACGRLHRTHRLSEWQCDFRRLLADGVSDETAQAVMNWYAREAGKAYTPQAYSGRSFRSKFPRLLELSGVAGAVISEQAAGIAERLRDHSCVTAFRDKLPAIAQSGLDAVGTVVKFLDEVESENGYYSHFAIYLLGHLQHAVWLIECEITTEIVRRFMDGQDPGLWVLRPTSRLFSRLFTEASISFTGDATMGENLYRKLLSQIPA